MPLLSTTFPTVANPMDQGPQREGSILGNLSRGLGELAVGIPMGLFEMAKATANDTVHGLTMGQVGDEFLWDNMARGVKDTYTHEDNWLNDLVHGRFRETGVDIWNRPLDPLLDLATLFTGGGAAVVKGGQLAGKAGMLGKGGKAFVAKQTGLTPRTLEGFNPRLGRVDGKDLHGPVPKELFDEQANVHMATGKDFFGDGQLYDNPTTPIKAATLRGEDGELLSFDKKLSTNPASRFGQLQLERLRGYFPEQTQNKRVLKNIARTMENKEMLLLGAQNSKIYDLALTAEEKEAFSILGTPWHKQHVDDPIMALQMMRDDLSAQLSGQARRNAKGRVTEKEMELDAFFQEHSPIQPDLKALDQNRGIFGSRNWDDDQLTIDDTYIDELAADLQERARHMALNLPDEAVRELNRKTADYINAVEELGLHQEYMSKSDLQKGTLSKLKWINELITPDADGISNAQRIFADPKRWGAAYKAMREVSREAEQKLLRHNPLMTEQDLIKNRGRHYRMITGSNPKFEDDLNNEFLIFRSDYLKPAADFPDEGYKSFDEVLKSEALKQGIIPREAMRSTGLASMTSNVNHNVDKLVETNASLAKMAIRADLLKDLRGWVKASAEGNPDKVPGLFKNADSAKLVDISGNDRVNALFKSRVRALRMDREATLARTLLAIPPGQEAKYSHVIQSLRGIVDDLPTDDEMAGPIRVPKPLVEALVGEWDATQKTKAWLAYDKATNVWKDLVLAYRPQWIVNNALGQAFLLLAAHGPVGAFQGLLAHFRMQGARRKASKTGKKYAEGRAGTVDRLYDSMKGSGSKELYGREDWSKNKPQSSESVDGGSMPEDNPDHRNRRDKAKDTSHAVGTKFINLFDRGANWMGDFNERVADDPFRKAAFIKTIDPSVKNLMKLEGVDYDTALARLADDPDFMDGVIQETLGDMIDFRDLSPFERTWIRRLFPFYSWMKGISVTSGKQLAERPLRSLATSHLAGQVGIRNVEDQIGDAPTYLKASLPIPSFLEGHLGLDDNSRMTIGQANPYASPVALTQTVLGMVPFSHIEPSYFGESFTSMLNPVMKGIYESLSQKDAFYGSQIQGKVNPDGSYDPMDRGQILTWKQLKDIPFMKLGAEGLDAYSNKLPSPNAMFHNPFMMELAQYMGLPISQLAPAGVSARGREEELRQLGIKERS
jgi:hypothetical protein